MRDNSGNHWPAQPALPDYEQVDIGDRAMTAQQSTSRPIGVPKWVVCALSVIAVLLALTFFGIAAAFHIRGLTDDTLAAVAAALIGGVFLIAGATGVQRTRCKDDDGTNATVASRIPNGISRVVALLLGTVAVLGGIDFLCMSFVVLNQEYLHQFEFSRSYHSGTGSQAALLAEFATMGFALTGTGIFLLWYSAHPFARFKVLIHRFAAYLRSDARPGAASASPGQDQSDCNAQESR